MQTDIFEYLYPRFKIDKPIRLIELFAGIGSQAKALERLGADFEHYNSALYKQAGNSIVVNVLESIFKMMVGDNND